MKLERKFVILILVCLVLLWSGHALAFTLGFDPSWTQAGVGESFVVDVVAVGNDEDTLAAFDLDISFNPSVLSLFNYTVHNSLGDLETFEALDDSIGDNGAGVLDLKVISLIWPDVFTGGSFFSDQFNGSNSSIALATITFHGLSAGSSDLAFSQAQLVDEGGALVSQVNLDPASVEVTPVPLPASVLFLGSGIAGLLVGISRKRRQRG